MTKITAKEVRTAAASVAGARGMGIETAASKAAPELLARAEAALRAMSGRADNEAISQSAGRVAAQADALESAIRELRDALGVAAEESAPADGSQAEPKPEEAGVEVDFEPAWEETCRKYGECYDFAGRRVAIFIFTRYDEGRMSSLGGWNAGGSVIGQSWVAATEDGRELEEGERVSVRGSSVERQLRGGRLDMAGVMGVAQTSATSEWLPLDAAKAPIVVFGGAGMSKSPAYQGDWDCSNIWEAAFEDRRARRAAAREAAKTPAKEEREWTLADLAALLAKRKKT